MSLKIKQNMKEGLNCQELIHGDGIYAQLWTHQTGGFIGFEDERNGQEALAS